MTIQKLVAGVKGAAGNSTGADVAAAVNGLIDGRVKQQQTAVLFGDSYAEAQNMPPLGNTTSFSLYRFLLGGVGNSISVIKNAGISGNRSDQMLARIETDVIPFKSDWVFFNCGVNDFFGSDRDLSSVQSDVTSILARLIEDGRKVLVFNCPPQVSTRTLFTPAKATKAAQYNSWLLSYAATVSGVVVVDIYSPFINWADTTNGGAVADFFANDGIHLSTLGEMVAAQAANQLLIGQINSEKSILNSPRDAGIAGTEGLFLGTGGTNGGGSSGSVATSYVSSRVSGTNGTIVNSKLPLRGQRQTFTLSAANGEFRSRLAGSLTAELTPFIGSTVTTKVLFRLRTISGGASLKDLTIKLYTADGQGLNQAVNGGANGGYAPITDTQFDTGVCLITLRNLTVGTGLSDAGMYLELLLDSVAGGVVELDIYGVEIRVSA
jgi:lysophospholipase L1-like esterase